MAVAGSRLAARSAADEGSRPPVNRASNSAPPTLNSAVQLIICPYGEEPEVAANAYDQKTNRS